MVYTQEQVDDLKIETTETLLGIVFNNNGRSADLDILGRIWAHPLFRDIAPQIRIPIAEHDPEQNRVVVPQEQPLSQSKEKSFPQAAIDLAEAMHPRYEEVYNRCVHAILTLHANNGSFKCGQLSSLLPEINQNQWKTVADRLVHFKLVRRIGRSRGIIYVLTGHGQQFATALLQ
jgi:hypothetical protein